MKHRLLQPSRLVQLAFVAVLLAIGFGVEAQQWRVPEGWSGGRFQREMVPSERKGFYICKLRYTSVRREPAGRGWDTDYPMAGRNLMIRLGELTATSVNFYDDGHPADGVVSATDSGLFKCPFLMGADVGTAGFSDEEVLALREYFLKGGFLWVDDFWGERAMEHWLGQLERILPGYERVILTPDHPLFSSFYVLEEVPQMPNIGFWRRTGGLTSERGAETENATLSAIVDDRGRVMVAMTHNTDLGDGMERESESYEFFERFSPYAYGVAINLVVYSMTR
jgi:hypothetical protein